MKNLKPLFLLFILISWKAYSTSYAVGEPVFRTITAETVYPFTVSEYTPHVKLLRTSKISDMSFLTPEDTVSSYISAMYLASTDIAGSMWDAQSRLMHDNLQKRLHQTNADDVARGLAYVKGNSFVLTHKIEYGVYTIIAFDIIGQEKNIKIGSDTLELKKIGARWFLTNDLSSDPVPNNWNKPGEKIETPPASFFPKQ